MKTSPPRAGSVGGNRQDIPALNGIRGVAALCVVAYHGVSTNAPGQMAVLCFFVLSGYLITLLLRREFDKSGTLSLRRFYIRRTLRIFPPFYAFWIAALLLFNIQPGASISAALYGYNYYHAIVNERPSAISGSWSLGVEEQFYLIWPAVLLFLSARPRIRLTSLLILAFFIIQMSRISAAFLGLPVGYIDYTFEFRCDALIVGCLLALTVGEDGWRVKLWWPLFPLSVLIICQIVVIYNHDLEMIWLHGVEAIAFGAFMVQVIALSDRWPWAWLDSAPLVALGAISYSLYLWHPIGLLIADRYTPAAWHWRYHIAAGFLASILLAALSYLAIELPMNRFKNRLTAGHGAIIAGSRAKPAMTRAQAG